MDTEKVLGYFQMDKNEQYELKSIEDFERMAKSAYESGIEFYMVVLNCMNMILSGYNHSVCTNIAFSCELFLKSIAFKKGIDCRKQHDLYQLYMLIPENDRGEIKKNHNCGNIRRDDFELNLKEVGKAFIVLRYSYERKMLAHNLQFLIELLMCLRSYCKKVIEDNIYI